MIKSVTENKISALWYAFLHNLMVFNPLGRLQSDLCSKLKLRKARKVDVFCYLLILTYTKIPKRRD